MWSIQTKTGRDGGRARGVQYNRIVIWAAIRDLDPDRNENESDVACVVTLVALAAVV
jgi:hypothetical protein